MDLPEPKVDDLVCMALIKDYGRLAKIVRIDKYRESSCPYYLLLLEGGTQYPSGYMGWWAREGFTFTGDDLAIAVNKWEAFFNGL